MATGSNRVRIAMAQFNPIVGDLRGNAARIVGLLREAEAAGCDFALFPELALSGYPPEDLLMRKRFMNDCAEALRGVISSVGNIIAVVGYPELDEKRRHNSAAVINKGNLVANYRKIELPNYGVFDEPRYFAPGGEVLRCEFGGLVFGVSICEDIWIPRNSVARATAASDIALNFNISASPFHAGKNLDRIEILKRFAGETGASLAYCNLVGGQDELVFDGGSIFMESNSAIRASSARFTEELTIFDCDIPVRARNAEKIDEIRSVTIPGGLKHGLSDTPRVAPEPKVLSRIEEKRAALVLGIRDYMSKNGFSKALLGMSGGIDSALVAALAAEAVGPRNLQAVSMPSRFSSPETKADAELVAKNLGIGFMTISIDELYEKYLEELSKPLELEKPGIECENLQARIRGNILMALSNKFGWLVLTTGNKSETAVGYSTLYGDTAGGFAPLKDLYKIRVYELARFVNSSAGRAVIPESVIARAPSAELRENQKDQDSLPPYEVLDQILTLYIEEEMTIAEIAGELRQSEEFVKEIARKVELSEYKRRQSPPGVKLTPRAFGRDRRMPITNRYHKDQF